MGGRCTVYPFAAHLEPAALEKWRGWTAEFTIKSSDRSEQNGLLGVI